tara:strand:+ start:1446 stop:1778 length:333 start_codon:yes stop_codon:yes gene_type:complete
MLEIEEKKNEDESGADRSFEVDNSTDAKKVIDYLSLEYPDKDLQVWLNPSSYVLSTYIPMNKTNALNIIRAFEKSHRVIVERHTDWNADTFRINIQVWNFGITIGVKVDY